MCRIVEKTEIDHTKKHQKMAEEEKKKKAIALEKQRERELKKAREEIYEEKNNVAQMYSEKRRRLENLKAKPAARKFMKKSKKVLFYIDVSIEFSSMRTSLMLDSIFFVQNWTNLNV